MIVNQTYGFAYIHIPKTAGTSVTAFLSPLNGPFDLELGCTEFGESIQGAYSRRHGLRKHSTLQEALGAIEMLRPMSEMFLFTFVRHPLARLHSTYRFLLKWYKNDPNFYQNVGRFQDFVEFLEAGVYQQWPGPDNIFLPQVTWIKYNNRVCKNVQIFKLEDVTSNVLDLRRILLSKGVDAAKLRATLPHVNVSSRADDSHLSLSQSLREGVNRHYAEDFECLGYPLL